MAYRHLNLIRLMNNKIDKIIAFLISAIIVILFLFSNSCAREEQKTEQLNAIQAKLDTTRDKLGRQTASIQAFGGTIKELESQVSSSSETIRRLKEDAKKHGSNTEASVSADVEVIDHVSGKTKVTLKDTIRKDSVIYIYSEYSMSIIKKWATYQMRMNRDSSFLASDTKLGIDMNIFRDYQKVDSVNRKWYKPNTRYFAPKILKGEMTLQNPDSGVREMHVYVQKEKKKNTGLKIVVGILSFEIIHKFITGHF